MVDGLADLMTGWQTGYFDAGGFGDDMGANAALKTNKPIPSWLQFF